LLLASGLDRDRYVPIVVLAENGPLRGDLEALGIEVHVRPLAVMRRSLMSPPGMGRVAAAWAADAGGLGRMARTRGVSLVHTNTSVTLGGAAAARIAQVPHVWHVREIYAGFERWWPAYRRLLVTADALPCVSEATAAQFDGIGPVRVVADGIAALPERAAPAAAREALGVAPGAFTVAVLGRLSQWKGQEVLIRALADVRLRDAGAVGLIAGAPWRGEERRERELRELTRQLGVTDRVRFLGFRDDVGTVLGAADVVAVPSTQPDPLPNAALEAGAAGCCVVAADHGGLPDMICDGVTGVLVPPGDVSALATALAGLAADPERRSVLAAQAARDLPERFAAEKLLHAVQGLYDELLG
jgi:glycosyltransferase involved in cell wall biosynthesis